MRCNKCHKHNCSCGTDNSSYLLKLVADLQKKVNELVSIDQSGFIRTINGKPANSNNGNFNEEDPSVPAWAKTPNKPKYTITEIEGIANIVDSKVDKETNKSLIENDLITKIEQAFIEVNTMAEMRALSSKQINDLISGKTKGVRLNGYYTKGDTPGAIEYYISDTTEVDDGGSVISVSGIKLEHTFTGMVSLKYFGLMNGGINDTNIVNKAILAVSRYKAEGCIVPFTQRPIMIDGVTQAIVGDLRTRGIIQKSNMIVRFEKGARFKIIPNSSGGYCGWNFYKTENVKIENATIIGERFEHISPNGTPWEMMLENTTYQTDKYVYLHHFGLKVVRAGTTPTTLPYYGFGTKNMGDLITIGDVNTGPIFEVVNINLGEWGDCIEIIDCKNVSFYDLRADEAWGDGVYLGCTDGETDRTKHNTNINFFGTTEFNKSRRQGMSIISVNNLYMQNVLGIDIRGTDPEAVIDFEPNQNYHTISGVIENITAIRCKRSVLFASQSNELKIKINSIQHIDSYGNGNLEFQGLGHTVTNSENYVYIGSFYSNKCNKAPIWLNDWFEGHQASIRVDNILIDEWNPTVNQATIVFFTINNRNTNIPKAISNVDIKGFGTNKKTLISGEIFRPFFMYNGMPLDQANQLKNINIVYNYFDYPLMEDGVSSFSVVNDTVRAMPIRTTALASRKETATTIFPRSSDVIYATSPTTTLRFNRRGFTEAVLINSYQATDTATFNLTLDALSGFTEIEAVGMTITTNSFTLRYGAIIKLQRVTDTKLRITLLYYGSKIVNSIPLLGTPANSDLLNIASSTDFPITDVFLHWDSSRTGLINYPPIGRGTIIQYTDSTGQGGQKTFLAMGYSGSSPVLFLGNKVGTVINWVDILQNATTTLKGLVNQSVLIEPITLPNATDEASDYALTNANKTKINEIITKLKTAGIISNT